jgi:hypothetical protein
MKRLRFVWIDDRKEKVAPYKAAIEAGLTAPRRIARIELIEVKKDILNALNDWLSKHGTPPPDLFVIDHVFDVAVPFRLRGSSVALLLRRTFPKTPMVCVSANVGRPGVLNQEDLAEYMTVIPYGDLSDKVEQLYAIARDFRKVEIGGSGVRQHLVDCLKAPPRDREDFLRVLPEEFQTQPHATTQHRVARWIYNVLLARPGFLYDRLHAATLLGLTEAGFEKIEPDFHRALYRGVFATQAEPRWWVSEIKRLLFSKAPADGPSEPQLAGRLLTGIRASDHSTCYISRVAEPPPDCVAFADTTPDAKLRVVRHEFTEQHPNDPGIAPGFEPRLVLQPRPRRR